MRNKESKKAYDAGYRADSREEIKAYNARYRAANREKVRATHRAWSAANREKIRVRKRMYRYGVSPEAFQLMLLGQKNACGICKEVFSKPPDVDHCHVTGKVRGLLCGICNHALGGFKDSLEILENAKEYLIK